MFDTERIHRLAVQLYGSDSGAEITRRIRRLAEEYRKHLWQQLGRDLSERDAMLIAYADQVTDSSAAPLTVLADFAEKHLRGLINTFHLLPFYPWSSDDGFSVTDFRAVAAQYGTWDDVRRLGRNFHLMLDAVINHASAQSGWFHLFRRGQAPYQDYFMKVDDDPDLSSVVRPRTTPLVTTYHGDISERAVWTTFGPDQVDLNYRSPALLIEMLDVLLFYAAQGAAWIRLDAAAYLWKEIGTTCLNLPQTHLLIQLMRSVLDQAAPNVKLITETNVPQRDNLAYLGDGSNEAHLVYNFSLPPLLLHAFHVERAEILGTWISALPAPSGQATFLNILSTHDGIGLNPLQGILPEREIEAMVQQCVAGGGLVSSKMNSNGTLGPYELNMNYWDALDALGPGVSADMGIERFVAAHAIMFSLTGVPAIYFHSLFGSRGWPLGVLRTGRNRSVNRQKLKRDLLEVELADPGSVRARVFRRLQALLVARAGCEAFSPYAGQRVLSSQGSVLALIRGTRAPFPRLLCLYNLGPGHCRCRLDDREVASALATSPRDLITGARLTDETHQSIDLKPYQSLWLALDAPE